MSDHHQISISVKLPGLTSRIQRLLQASTNLVAIGLNAGSRVTSDDLELPDVSFRHEFSTNSKLDIENVAQGWQTWVLRNGFRDIAEAISGLMEESQTVLSHWQLAKLQESRQLCGDDWNELIVNRATRFHRLGLPDKISFLDKEYGVSLPRAQVDKVLSINAARNCLVHRGGIVGPQDTHGSDRFRLEWSALVVLAMEEDGTEQEIEPPHFVEAGQQIGVATRDRAKEFMLGEPVVVSAIEYQQVCWTLFQFASACAQALEAHGKSIGIKFRQNAP